MASAAPFLILFFEVRSTPLILVCAVNGTNWAFSASSSERRNFSFARTTILRPSGVSSAREARYAALASFSSDTPVTGKNLLACRLPSVIVPVLSRRRTSTSPAASTARPDVAMTLACIRRLMPATPIAERRPAIVVGIRQTSNATRTIRLTGCPIPVCSAENWEKGNKVTTTPRKTMVSATSKMVSAISLGVFCRLALSTMAIIRSTKVSPGLDVTRTTRQSDRTFVPPVTAEKSPPDSRITGADSPVIALSSTEAEPSRISPSAGMKSPAGMRTRSLFLSDSASIS